MQKWAAETPFAIEDATEATKKLVAAGVPFEDIPDWLNDIGNTAAATGVPLSQAATVFAQMVVARAKRPTRNCSNSPRAASRSGRCSPTRLGLTVAEVQKMATEGKLGADAIALTREALNELYPTAMQQQAETFNGQMSTLQDNLSQTGQTLGTLFLPMMTLMVAGLNKAAGWLLIGAQKFGEFDDKLRDLTGGDGLFEGVMQAVPGVGPLMQSMEGLGDETEDTATATGDLTGEVDALADAVTAGMDDGTAAAEAFRKRWRPQSRPSTDAVSAFAGAGRQRADDRLASSSTSDDLREQITEAIEGTEDAAAVTLPANLNITRSAG